MDMVTRSKRTILPLSGMMWSALAVFGNFDPLEQKSLTEDKKTDCMTAHYEDQHEYASSPTAIVHYCTTVRYLVVHFN